jgi:hypothetical protein
MVLITETSFSFETDPGSLDQAALTRITPLMELLRVTAK